MRALFKLLFLVALVFLWFDDSSKKTALAQAESRADGAQRQAQASELQVQQLTGQIQQLTAQVAQLQAQLNRGAIAPALTPGPAPAPAAPGPPAPPAWV